MTTLTSSNSLGWRALLLGLHFARVTATAARVMVAKRYHRRRRPWHSRLYLYSGRAHPVPITGPAAPVWQTAAGALHVQFPGQPLTILAGQLILLT